MSNLTTITSKGQVTIPEDIRLLLGIKPGDKVVFEKAILGQKKAVLRVLSGEISERLYGSLKTSVKFRGRKHEREITKKLISQLRR